MNLQSSIPQPKLGRHLRPLPSRSGYREFEIYSLTRAGHEHEHMVCIGLEDGSVHCSCEHFMNRFARTWPHISDTERHCKHITRALNYLKRRKELPAMHQCVSCPSTNAEHGLADDNGRAVEAKFICADCVKRAQMMQGPEPVDEEPEDFAGFEEWLDELECGEELCPHCNSLLEELPVPFTQSLDYSMQLICPACDA
jgi:hypothetical protein